MPPHATPQQPAARSSPGPGSEPDREPPDPGRSQSTTPAPATRHRDVAPRDFVRLFQCRVCSLPLREPVSLPCGKTMCRRCLPETHRRSNITYPAAPDRLRGFRCPFSDCAREHALDDCAVDVVLNKTAGHVRDEVDRRKLQVHGSTRVEWPDPWAAAGITSMREDDAYSKVIQGGKVVATYSLAAEGDLSYDTDITCNYIPSPPTSPSPASTVDDDDDSNLIRKAQDATRAEMDCQVCYALFYDPLTTPCGHTFCRSCLHRILDHSRYCPICRRPMAINPVLSQNSSPSNETITRIIEAFWLDEVHARKEALDAERASQMQDFDLPLFICTLSFPLMPTFLHIFEPRYRLMIRRALEGDRTFGMVLPKRPEHSDDVDFYNLGTLLRIVNIQYYPDGRSLVETVGLSRFRVRNHSYLDGYTVAKIERVDDVSLEQEEAMEAMEAVPPAEQPSTQEDSSIQGDKDSHDSPSSTSPPPAVDSLPMPSSPEEIDAMSTQSLMQFASSFVARMRVQSVPWLTERMLTIYGECPDDAAIFPWWFASMLPVKDLEKYRLLGTSSVRERLKICCSWIVEWQTSRWIKLIDGRSGLSTTAQSSD